MEKLLLIIGLAVLADTLAAQPHALTRKKPFFNDFHLEFPMFETKTAITIKDKSLRNQPYGINDLFSHPTPYTSVIWTSFRWIALYYKDRFGLEFYSDGYSNQWDLTKFGDYLQKRYPGYYFRGGSIVSDFEFGGQAIGLAYRMHWKGLTIEPKFLLGFESFKDDSTWYSTAYFKQPGSNHFVEYSMGRYEITRHQKSYQGRLLIGKKWKNKNGPAEYEIGAQFEYIYSPYTMQLQINERPYGQPPNNNQLIINTRASIVNLGIYGKIYPHWWRR